MLLAGLAASIFHLLLNDMAVYATTITNYCVPYHPTHGNATGCWPKKEQWGTLGNTLTGKLHYLDPNNYDECYAMEDDAFKIEQTAHGMCMQYHDCSKAFCQVSAAWNIPYYSVEAHNYGDIKKALDFARNHNIAVTVKTSGHSYSGSSTGYGTLMIWMHRFTKYGQIQNNFKDSCNTATVPTVLKIGGGQTWKEAYDAVGDKYHIVGGGGLSVSAAGGWLMGGGQSALSRNLGLGIDNVLQLEVVLADGSKVTADRCNAYSDLFWALRGGGGGTFGIVISALYKLHPVTNIVYTYFSVDDIVVYPWPHLLTYSFLDFWVDRSPHLDNRWGGYWTLNTFVMYFQGSREDADKTFINDVNAWIKSKSSEDQRKITFTVSSHDSYYNQRGGKWATTDKTGQIEFFIASRLVPKSFVVNDPAAAKSMLKWMVNNGFYTFNYILGGEMMNVDDTDTAVHPAMRKALWEMIVFSENMIEMLRKEVKTDSAAGFNHAAKNETNWEDSFWGSNLARLKNLKKKYDPTNVFNCWHCVGYKEMPKNPHSSSSGGVCTFTDLVVFFSLCLTVYDLIL